MQPFSSILIFLLSSIAFYTGATRQTIRFSDPGTAADTIYWSADYKLKWDDFKGKPMEESIKKAETFSGISYEIHGEKGVYRPSLKVFFIKTLSWRKTEDDTLLLHEQGHYDLTEIYARKLWKELKENDLTELSYERVKHEKGKIRKLYSEYFSQLKAAQNEYDRETKHSILRQEQKKWLEKIKSELEGLESYKK